VLNKSHSRKELLRTALERDQHRDDGFEIFKNDFLEGDSHFSAGYRVTVYTQRDYNAKEIHRREGFSIYDIRVSGKKEGKDTLH
jgi:spore coat polysaccharide biosynthesis protein SpsF (cytidylyltransferase family)